MTLANIHLDMGLCETYPSTLLHCAINFPLSTDIGVISSQIISCPVGKRVVVLAGRITSNEECHLLVCDGDFPIDHHAPAPFLFERADLPAENYLLPPTTICQPHMRTRTGHGLWFWGETFSASSEERLVFGYLKYLLLEALPLGEPLWGVISDCYEALMELSWPPVQGAESYTLQRLDFVGNAELQQWVTIYEDEDPFYSEIRPGEIKRYRFKAANEEGESGWSEQKSIVVKPSFSLTITLDEAQTVCSVYWGAVAGAKYFEVYRDDVLISTTNYLGIADPLVAGQTYNYLVKAYVFGTCFGQATGSLEVVDSCLQPVITVFGVSIQGQMDGVPIALIYWWADHATSYELYQDGVAIPFENMQTAPTVAFNNTYAFRLVAICGDKQAEQTINYFVDPCMGQAPPPITYFEITQSIETGDVTFDWTAVDSYGGQEIKNNDAVVVTANTDNGHVTIPQPAILDWQTFILRAKGINPLCFSEATRSIILVDGDPCIGSGAPIITSFEVNRFIDLITFHWTADQVTIAKLYENEVLIHTDNTPGNGNFSVIRPTGYYEYRLDCLNAANCLTSTLQEMNVPDLTFKPIDESAFPYGFNSADYYFPASGNDWNKCKGIIAQWPSNMGFPTSLNYEWLLKDNYGDYIDITIVSYIYVLKPVYTSQPSSHNLEKVAHGKIAEGFALDYRPSQQPSYWWQRTFTACSGVLGLQSSDMAKGDMWSTLQKDKGIDFATVAPTVTYSDVNGIYKNFPYLGHPRGWDNGDAIGTLSGGAIKSNTLWVSFQVRNPVKSGGGFLRPVSAQVTAIAENDVIKQTAMLTGCKYHTMSNGEISVIGGYITNSFYEANFFTSGTGNNSYLVLSQVSFGV